MGDAGVAEHNEESVDTSEQKKSNTKEVKINNTHLSILLTSGHTLNHISTEVYHNSTPNYHRCVAAETRDLARQQ